MPPNNPVEEVTTIQHVYHHYDEQPAPRPIVHMKVERNSRGYNYSASIEGAGSVEEAKSLLDKAMGTLAADYAPELQP